MNTYTVYYNCLDDQGRIIKQGAIKTRKDTEFAALAGTENHLKSKIPGMVKMVCRDLTLHTMLGEISVWKKDKSNPYGDIFGGGNPFGI